MMHQKNQFPHDFFREHLELISQYIPGEMTLNQIRVLQYIALRSASDEGGAGNSEICEALGMSGATVTRAICSGIKARIVSEEEDPRDGRRRIVTMSNSYPRQRTLDQKVIALARKYFQKGRAVSEIK